MSLAGYLQESKMQVVCVLLAACTVASLYCVGLGSAETLHVEVGETGEYTVQLGQLNFIYSFSKTEEGQVS